MFDYIFRNIIKKTFKCCFFQPFSLKINEVRANFVKPKILRKIEAF